MSTSVPPAPACPSTARCRSWQRSDSARPANRKDAMSLTSALKKVFGKPYGKAPAPNAAALAERGAILLDVREPREWQAGHAHRAWHIPLSQISRRAGELPEG